MPPPPNRDLIAMRERIVAHLEAATASQVADAWNPIIDAILWELYSHDAGPRPDPEGDS